MARTPATPPTVREVIDALSALDPDLPVVVSTAYDNDIAHSGDVEVTSGLAYYSGEGQIWSTTDDPSTVTGAFTAIFITATSD